MQNAKYSESGKTVNDGAVCIKAAIITQVQRSILSVQSRFSECAYCLGRVNSDETDGITGLIDYSKWRFGDPTLDVDI